MATLHAGVARVEITPPLGVEMCGYGPYEKRQCTEVLDPLYARALWLAHGEARLLIVSADLCMLDRALRDAAATELAARCGLPATAIMLVATHTHSGPATLNTVAWGAVDPTYRAWLTAQLVEAGAAACAAAVPARVGACRARVEGVGINREQPAIGPLDTAAQLLRVDTAAGQPLAALFNFGAHAVVRYPFTTRISADWPGMAATHLEQALGVEAALFLQGPCGNLNGHAMTFDRTDPRRNQVSCDMRVGDTALHLCAQILPALRGIVTAEVPLAAAWREIALPIAPPDPATLQARIAQYRPLADSRTLADLPPLHARLTRETEEETRWRRARFEVDAAEEQLRLLADGALPIAAPLQVLTIGDARLVGWPGEIFVELGLELRQRSPHPLTFVASFANDDVGYIPTAAVFESRGQGNDFGRYPREMTPEIYRRLPFRADVGQVLVEETLGLLRDCGM